MGAASHLSSVPGDEVVHGLLQSELAHGRKHTKRVACEQDDVVGMASHAGDLGVVNVLDGVRATSVLCDED